MELETILGIQFFSYIGKLFGTMPDPIRSDHEQKLDQESRDRLHSIEGNFLVLPTPIDFMYLGYLAYTSWRDHPRQTTSPPPTLRVLDDLAQDPTIVISESDSG